jgi:serine/threonine-protein kinase RsbW
MDEQPVEGRIELALPADPRLVRLARLVASGVASGASFDIEEIEDLRIAVDEGCIALIEAGDGSRLELEFVLDGPSIEVRGTTAASSQAMLDTERLSLSTQILKVVTDEHDLTVREGRATFRLRKESRAGDGSGSAVDVD